MSRTSEKYSFFPVNFKIYPVKNKYRNSHLKGHSHGKVFEIIPLNDRFYLRFLTCIGSGSGTLNCGSGKKFRILMNPDPQYRFHKLFQVLYYKYVATPRNAAQCGVDSPLRSIAESRHIFANISAKLKPNAKTALDWFTSYLLNRKQQVDINGNLSDQVKN
jgi:hypothetical protein